MKIPAKNKIDEKKIVQNFIFLDNIKKYINYGQGTKEKKIQQKGGNKER